MKIIIAGAGLTGSSIISYLSQTSTSDDVVVIDVNQQALSSLASKFDVQTIQGSSTNPEVLKQAGAKNADVIMALTDSDEVNMVTCQMAYSLFNISKKIARIETTELVAPVWKNLYNEENMPIDYMISTDTAIANNIFSLIKIPQVNDFATIKDDKISMMSFKVSQTSPVINAQILELERLFDNIEISILLIIRNGSVIIPTQEDFLKEGDEVFFITPEECQNVAIEAFGKEAQSNERILIFGANRVCELLLNLLEKDSVITNIKVIEENTKKAQNLNFKYNETSVIQGSFLNSSVLSDAKIDKADVSVCLADNDKDNILFSVLSNSFNVNTNVSLLNSGDYDYLLKNLDNTISIDKSALISSLLVKAIRNVNLDFAYVLSQNYGEIWGLKVEKRVDYKKIIKLKGFKLGLVIRDGVILYDVPLNGLQRKDYVILFVENKMITKVEELFE